MPQPRNATGPPLQAELDMLAYNAARALRRCWTDDQDSTEIAALRSSLLRCLPLMRDPALKQSAGRLLAEALEEASHNDA